MSDDQIRAAFEQAMDAVEPPADAQGRVAARVARRRRNRAILGGGLAVALVAGVGGIAWAQRDDGSPSDRSAVATDPPSASPSVVPVTSPPTEVTCPAGTTLRTVSFEHGGYRRFTQLVAGMDGAEGAAYVDRAAAQMWLLRADGTAYAQVPWMGGGEDRWFPDGIVECEGEEVDPVPIASEPVQFEIGHCWLAPVTIAGSSWDVIEEDQGGGGGLLPEDFAGSGQAWLAGDVALYRDAGGALLTLVPEGDPWAVTRDGCQ